MFYIGMGNVKPIAMVPPTSDGPWAIVGFGLTLGQVVAGGHVRARCRCGRQGSVDPGYWVWRGWANRRLDELDDRLRCACGQRRVMLEAAVGPVRPGDAFYMPP